MSDDSENKKSEAHTSSTAPSDEASESDEATRPEPAAESKPAAEGESAPKKKKKKKKKKKAEPEAASEPAAPAKDAKEPEPVLDVTGAEKAAFLGWFPTDPELDRLVRAFEVGNYALVRERAPDLIKSAKSDKVRSAARELLARIEPDPLMKYLLGAAIALLLFLMLYAYRHAH